MYENVLNSETLGISKVVINKSLPEIENRQRIVELFRRLNDGGTRLSSFDLVASILKGFSWKMEGFLKEMLETYQDIGLTQDNLIKLIFLLQDNHKIKKWLQLKLLLDSSFVYYLMYDRARTTRTNDIDHIMPKNILETKGYDGRKINSIKNFQLLDYGTNRGTKNGSAFADWVNNPSYVKDKASYVAIHLIPADETLWTEDNFERFAEERAKLILRQLDS